MIAGRPGKSRSLICFVDRRRGREEEDGNGWLAADQLAACLPFSFSFSGRQGRGRARTPEAPPPSHSLEQRGPSPAQPSPTITNGEPTKAHVAPSRRRESSSFLLSSHLAGGRIPPPRPPPTTKRPLGLGSAPPRGPYVSYLPPSALAALRLRLIPFLAIGL